MTDIGYPIYAPPSSTKIPTTTLTHSMTGGMQSNEYCPSFDSLTFGIDCIKQKRWNLYRA